jgi:CheY-like chemotaxis protein|eukprot:GHVU01134849.1.p1 GENE.GHVU01134849.1~~GHVU01134849.1.p1  ORF type:complete len:148 (-),score=8.12 GHVU01134849.1:356-799(-)
MYPDKISLILAEDDEDDRMFFNDAFNAVKIRHTLTMVEDGDALMEHLSSATELPHVLFIDLFMPGKTGMECLKEIRSDSRYHDVCIAIYSTSAQTSLQEEAFINGANIYIKKPKDFENLKRIISDVVQLSWQYVTDGLDRENFMVNY